jgi:hypothetical protein
MKQQFNQQDFGPKAPSETATKTTANRSVSPFNPNEQSFREMIKARLPRRKAGNDLIQAIKASIKRTDA